MKKILAISAVIIVAALVFGVAGFAYAQTQTPPSDNAPYGPGMMGGWNNNPSGGYGGMMGRMNRGGGYGQGMMGGRAANGAQGPLHTYMLEAFASTLNMTPADLQAQLDAGETMWTVAQANGISSDEFITLMTGARASALQAAVEAGTLTQEQADWMNQRMGQRNAKGYGPADCPMNNAAPAATQP